LAVGLVLFYFLWMTVAAFPGLIRGAMPNNGYWFGLLLSFWVLPAFIDPTYGRPIGRKVQIGFVVLAVAIAGYSQWQSGKIWGPGLGTLTGLLMLYVTAHGWLAFTLAGLLAVPG
jgi:hypothetical protein